ncbi:hypothetical protein KIS4809_2167 [Bacillus sp. ZZV12-4809]|nr:hypothetical protein KIS4809_2167 [Bacillus sp. ZZV12-4809]
MSDMDREFLLFILTVNKFGQSAHKNFYPKVNWPYPQINL